MSARSWRNRRDTRGHRPRLQSLCPAYVTLDGSRAFSRRATVPGIMAESDRFRTTSWSLVLAASDQAGAGEALARLCETYWHPVYAFIRRNGSDPDKAQDLTQEFFARLIEKNYLEDADRRRGRFRSFLLTSVKHFLANEWDREQALKRGGGRTFYIV